MIFTQKYRLVIVVSAILMLVSMSSCGAAKNKKPKEENQTQGGGLERPGPNPELIYKNNFYEAIRLKTVGDIQASKEKLLWCLSQKPEDDAVLYMLSVYDKEAGKMNEALGYIERAAEVDPSNIWYVETLAELQLTLDMLQEAELSFQKLTESNPNRYEWLYSYVNILVQNQKPEQALLALNRLIVLSGPVTELVQTRCGLHLQLTQEMTMIEEMRSLILAHPNKAELPEILLNHYHNRNQLRQAELDFLDILNQNEKHGAAQLALAHLYLLNKQADLSLTPLTKAIEINNLDANAYVKVLGLYLDLKADQKVLSLVELLKKNHPDNSAIQELLSKAYLASGDNSTAIQSMEETLKKDPNNLELMFQLIDLYKQSKEHQKALAAAENGLSFFPNQAVLYLEAAKASYEINLADQALDYLNMGLDFVINNKPLEAQFLMEKARIYLAKKDLEKAKAAINQASSLDSKNSEILELHGDILFANKQINEAVELWKSARDMGNSSQELENKIQNRRIE